jgi:hypothetical protein
MNDLIPKIGDNNIAKLQFITSTILTEYFTQLLENIIEKEYEAVSLFKWKF